MFWTYYHKANSIDKERESPEPPPIPTPSLAELADNVTQSWSDGDINWAAVHWEVGTIGLGRWGQPCLECYKTVKNTREYQRWIRKRNEEMSNHERLTFNMASHASLTPNESIRRPANSHTDGTPSPSRSNHDDAGGGGEAVGLSRPCRSRVISQGPLSSSVGSLGPVSEDHQPAHCISGQDEPHRGSVSGTPSAVGSASRRRSFVARTRIVNLSELYPGFPIPESMMLQPSTHLGAGDTRTGGVDVDKGDVVNDEVMSLLHGVCDTGFVKEQQGGTVGTEGLGCLADRITDNMPTDNMSEGEREGSDDMKLSLSIAGSASPDTVPESTAEHECPEVGSEFPDTIQSESTAESEFPDTIQPKSTAQGDFPGTTQSESTAESEFPDTIQPKSTAQGDFPGTTQSESTAESEFPDTIQPKSTAQGDFPGTTQPESTAESEFPDTIQPKSTAQGDFPDTTQPESTAESESKNTIQLESTVESEMTDTIQPESTADCEASDTVTIISSAVDADASDTKTESTAEAGLSYIVSESAEGESFDTKPPDSTAESEPSVPVYTATPKDELFNPVSDSTTEAKSDSVEVSNIQSPESVAPNESELSDTVPYSIFGHESPSYTMPDSTDETDTDTATTEGEAISLSESGSSGTEQASEAEVFTEAESQAHDEMPVVIVDDKPQVDQAASNPPVTYPECIEALDAVIDEHDSDSVVSENSKLHTNSPVESSDELCKEGHHAYQYSDHVSIETVMHELESRSRAAVETSYNISPKTSSTDSGTVAVMFGRDADPTGSTSLEDSNESEKDSEWPESTISDNNYSIADVVSCPQRSPSPLEATVGSLWLSYSSPCLLVTSSCTASSPKEVEPSCPVDQGLEEESNSSSSSSEALICKPSGDASELYASDVSFVDDDDDGDDDEYDAGDDPDDVHYDDVAGYGSGNSLNTDDNAGVDGNAVIDDDVDGEGNSISEDVDLFLLESGVAEVDVDVDSDVFADDNSACVSGNDEVVDNDVDAAAVVDFHVNSEADANAVMNVEAFVQFGASVDAISYSDVVAYTVDTGVGSDSRVDVDVDIDVNIDVYVDSHPDVKDCVALHVEVDADAGPHSDVKDDDDIEVGLTADVDGDGTDTATDVDAVVDFDAVSDTNDVSVPTNGGSASTGDMDGRDNHKQQQQFQQQQHQRHVIITNIEGPAVVSNVSVGTTSSTTLVSSASGNAHFLLDKSLTDSDLNISVIYLDNEPQDPDPVVHIDSIPDNPPSGSSSTETLQFSSLISDEDFVVPCKPRPDISTSTVSQTTPGLREGCYVS